MAAANFVVINGEGCALNGTAVAAVFIDVLSFSDLRLVVDCR